MTGRVEVFHPAVISPPGRVFARTTAAAEWDTEVERHPTAMAECYIALAGSPFPTWPTLNHFRSQRKANMERWEFEAVRDEVVVIYGRGHDGRPIIVYCGHPRA